MNYKAHVPAGIAFAAAASVIMAEPAIVPLLIGGAIGGALPDVDVESGAAIEKIGSKTAQVSNKILGKAPGGRIITRLSSVFGAIFDKIIMRPLCMGWRFIAKNMLAPAYLALYNIGGNKKTYTGSEYIQNKNGEEEQKQATSNYGGEGCLGKKLGWDPQSPEKHRGGLTHSFFFMLLSLIILVPLSLLFGGWEFAVGCEIGIFSHLIADAMCRSGVMFFWPWVPKIGFPDINGRNVGHGIRIMPTNLLVKTGAEKYNENMIEAEASSEEEKNEMRKLRRREKMWQKIFQISAILLIILLIAGPGFLPGGVSMSFADTAQQQAQEETNTTTTSNGTADVLASFFGWGTSSGTSNENSNSDITQSSDNQNSASTNGNSSSETQTNNQNSVIETSSGKTMIAETDGPASLTLGDLDVAELPTGIMKMPDESLYVIGVGPVNEENLNNPKWTFTSEEKTKLLAAATAQKANDVPSNISSFFSDAGSAASNAVNEATNAATNATNSNSNSNSGTISGWINDLFGVDIGNTTYEGGFLGITPYTETGNTNNSNSGK